MGGYNGTNFLPLFLGEIDDTVEVMQSRQTTRTRKNSQKKNKKTAWSLSPSTESPTKILLKKKERGS